VLIIDTLLHRFGYTQQKLLAFLLDEKFGLTIEKLTKMLGISRTAVQQHITSLERDGFVERHSAIKTGGRPKYCYRLTIRGIHLYPKQYAFFAATLLSAIKQKLGQGELDSMLANLANQVAEGFRHRLQDKSANQQVVEIARILDELGYVAKTISEATSELPTIVASNCVYHNLAKQHCEMCAFDRTLLASLSGRAIEHSACIAQGESHCCFSFL